MQAASLANDLDLSYSRADYDRFVAEWGGPPDGLILQKREGGTKLAYGKPFLYALVTAPFVRFAPLRGALIANALLLAAASLLAARTLRLRVGPAAPLYVAAFVFASVAFAYTFWVHADLFLMAATAAGFALAYAGDGRGRERGAPPPSLYEPERDEPAGKVFRRFLAVGALLAVPVAFRPCYGLIFLPAALAAPAARRGRALLGLAAGAAAVLALTALAQWGAGGTWTGYGGLRQGLYARTGYPDVQFPAARFEAVMAELRQHLVAAGGGDRGRLEPAPLGLGRALLPDRPQRRDPALLPPPAPRRPGRRQGARALGDPARRGRRRRPASSPCGRSTSSAAPGRSATATSCRSTRRSGSSPRGRGAPRRRSWSPPWRRRSCCRSGGTRPLSLSARTAATATSRRSPRASCRTRPPRATSRAARTPPSTGCGSSC